MSVSFNLQTEAVDNFNHIWPAILRSLLGRCAQNCFQWSSCYRVWYHSFLIICILWMNMDNVFSKCWNIFQTVLNPTKTKKKIQILLNIKNSPFSTNSLIYWSSMIVCRTCNKAKTAILNFDIFVVPDSVRLLVPCIVCNIKFL